MFGLADYFRSKKKSDYMINTGRSQMLDSGFFENEVWGALIKAWKGYKIAKNKGEHDKLLHYADIIQECQEDLKLKVASFPDIGKSALAFHASRVARLAQNIKNTSNFNHRVSSVKRDNEDNKYYDTTSNEKSSRDQQGETLTDDNTHSEYFADDYYESERLTDDKANNEYFKDDYNESDRFTS